MSIPARELRAWAKGDYPTEAAIELLIRAKNGRFARISCPWIQPLGPGASLYRADWDRLHDEAGVFSGGERRLLNIAVSMGSPDHPVDLSNTLSGLDDDLLLLILAATAHAAGRPRLLTPASAVTVTPSPTHPTQTQAYPGRNDDPTPTPSPTPRHVTPTDPHHAPPVRRPDQERRVDHHSPEQPHWPRA